MIKFILMLCFMALVAQATRSTWGLLLGWWLWHAVAYLKPFIAFHATHYHNRRHN
jgi:hypothetical protein